MAPALPCPLLFAVRYPLLVGQVFLRHLPQLRRPNQLCEVPLMTRGSTHCYLSKLPLLSQIAGCRLLWPIPLTMISQCVVDVISEVLIGADCVCSFPLCPGSLLSFVVWRALLSPDGVWSGRPTWQRCASGCSPGASGRRGGRRGWSPRRKIRQTLRPRTKHPTPQEARLGMGMVDGPWATTRVQASLTRKVSSALAK